jgi:hypothetical protein
MLNLLVRHITVGSKMLIQLYSNLNSYNVREYCVRIVKTLLCTLIREVRIQIWARKAVVIPDILLSFPQSLEANSRAVFFSQNKPAFFRIASNLLFTARP